MHDTLRMAARWPMRPATQRAHTSTVVRIASGEILRCRDAMIYCGWPRDRVREPATRYPASSHEHRCKNSERRDTTLREAMIHCGWPRDGLCGLLPSDS